MVIKKMKKSKKQNISNTLKFDERMRNKLSLNNINPTRAVFLEHYSRMVYTFPNSSSTRNV